MASTISTDQDERVSATGGSARSQADDLDERRWQPRRGVAIMVRFVSFAIPVVVAAIVVHVAGAVVTRPHGTFALVAWLVALAVLATVTVRIVDHVSRRMLPLSALLQLSLVFPDHAPSRFGVALRSGSGRTLERAVERSTAVGEFPAPQEAAELVVALISSLSRHDRMTRGHSERVRAYADLIGRQMHLDDDARAKLHWAALIHDIGKLDVPPAILNKKGRPTDDEWLVLRGHPAASGQYLQGLEQWLGEWARAASEHHERVDGSGYPLGLAGAEISLAGRIVAVADAFDVMTSARSYKKPHPAARARAELAENAGTQFDPEVVRAFLSVSLRDVSLVMGPLAILTQVPTLAQLPLEAAASALGPAVAGVAATALAFAAPTHGRAPRPGTAAARLATNPAIAGRSATATTAPGSKSVTSTTTRRGKTANTAVPGATPTTSRAQGPGGTTPNTTTASHPPTTVGTTTTTAAPVVNHPPVAAKDTQTKLKQRTVWVYVLANDSDPDGNLDPSTLTIVRPPQPGKYESIAVVNGAIRFTAIDSPKSSATFRYQVCDTDGACAQAEVSLNFTL